MPFLNGLQIIATGREPQGGLGDVDDGAGHIGQPEVDLAAVHVPVQHGRTTLQHETFTNALIFAPHEHTVGSLTGATSSPRPQRQPAPVPLPPQAFRPSVVVAWAPNRCARCHHNEQRDRPAQRAAQPLSCITPSKTSFFQTVMLPWSRSSSMPMRSPCSSASCIPSQSLLPPG